MDSYIDVAIFFVVVLIGYYLSSIEYILKNILKELRKGNQLLTLKI
jgi:hypothetical protein